MVQLGVIPCSIFGANFFSLALRFRLDTVLCPASSHNLVYRDVYSLTFTITGYINP